MLNFVPLMPISVLPVLWLFMKAVLIFLIISLKKFGDISISPPNINLLSSHMCLNPRKIFNPKRQFSQAGGHPLFMSVPCGHCAECETSLVRSYKLRAYYEAFDCFQNGGFILNDTLTYAPKFRPHISDFEPMFKNTIYDHICFNHEHFRLFFVRLRKRLTDLGYDVADKLKYFLASEYGTKEGHDHAPHYHVLFFVRINIDPLEFSKLVSECWQYGRTDGLPYQPEIYVKSKRLFSRSTNNDLIHLQNVVMYVTKYLLKDSSFQKTIDTRLNTLKEKLLLAAGLSEGDIKKRPLLAQRLRTLRRNVSQFHRNSHGFGLAALKYNNVDEVKTKGFFIMPSSKGVILRVPIPTYFSRKLFYELVPDFRGKKVWKLTPEGVQRKINDISNSIALLSARFSSWYESLSTLHDNSDVLKSQINFYLHGRTFNDFASYILCYKGRLVPYSYDINRLPSPEDMILSSYEETCNAYLCFVKQFGTDIHISFSHHTDDDIDTSVYDFNPCKSSSNHSYYSFKKYCFERVITETKYPQFRDFDKLYNLYCSTQISLNVGKQEAHNKKQLLEKQFKPLKFQTAYA